VSTVQHPRRTPGRQAGLGAAAIAAVAALAALVVLTPLRAHGPTLGVALTGLLVLATLAYLAWAVHPAVMMSGAVALGVFAGHWQSVGVPGPLALERLLMLTAAAAVIVRTPWMRNRPPLELRAVHWLMAAMIVYVVVSAASVGTLEDRTDFFILFDRFGVVPWLAFLVAPLAFAAPSSRDAFLLMLVALGAYLGYVALMSALHAGGLVFPGYVAAVVSDPDARAVGPFLEPATNGFALYMCAVGCALACLRFPQRWLRAICLVVLCLCAAGLLFTVTRQVWLASIAATVVTMSAFHELRRLLLYAVPVGIVGVLVALAVIPGFAAKATERKNDQNTVWDRKNQIRAGLLIVDQKPLFGVGWQRFQSVSKDYFREAPGYPLTGTQFPVHNVFVSYAGDLGLIGAIGWTAVLLLGVGSALIPRGPPEFRWWRAGLLALFVFYLVLAMFEPVNSYPNIALWTWAGLVLAGSAAAQRGYPRRRA
jgi:putative inorganic carbon (hco3(-)) transporter